MDNDKIKEQQLEEKLKKLPKITDNQSKDVLYRKIEARMETKKVRRRWSWMIPSFASVAVIGLLFIIAQDTMNRTYQNANESQSEEMVYEKSLDGNEEFDQEVEEKNDTISNDQNIDRADESSEEIKPLEEDIDSSMVYYKNVEQEQLFTIASIDKHNQYAIPITLVDPSGGEPNDYYNRINSFISEEQEEALGINQFSFEGLTFDVELDNKQVTMTVADDYSFPDGSSSAHVFEQIVTIMFKSFGVDEVVVQSPEGNPVQLGSFGEINALDVKEDEEYIYKVYRHENKNPLLVPIPSNSDDDIKSALEKMQMDEPEYNIEGPIPQDATFEVDSNQDNLSISFTKTTSFDNNQTKVSMIEAILMTAKSFGFQSVSVDLPGDVNVVGDYDLNEKIPVPDGVNPTILH